MNKELKYTLGYFFGVFLVAIILNLFYNLQFFQGLRLLFGLTFALFLPGFVVVRCFFWDRNLDWIEKLGLSFGLSITLIITLFMITNLVFKIPMTALNNALVILVLIFLIILIRIYKKPLLACL